jgi:DNA-binding NarL/FixJ family response regulator
VIVDGPRDPRELPVTDRQRELLYLLSLGLEREEVGHRMELSVNTIKTHVGRLYRRLGVRSAAEATRVGFERGLLTARHRSGDEVG